MSFWSVDDKARIVEETLAPGAVVSEIARKSRADTTAVVQLASRGTTIGRGRRCRHSAVRAGGCGAVDVGAGSQTTQASAGRPRRCSGGDHRYGDRRRDGARRAWCRSEDRGSGDPRLEGNAVIGPTGSVRIKQRASRRSGCGRGGVLSAFCPPLGRSAQVALSIVGVVEQYVSAQAVPCGNGLDAFGKHQGIRSSTWLCGWPLRMASRVWAM